MSAAGEKRQFSSTDDVGVDDGSNKRQAHEFDCIKTGAHVETDPVKIQSRLKQIQFGKNTIGYDNYTAAVPRRKRYLGGDQHPRTPDAYEILSKRAFDGKIKVWRRALHRWDSQGDSLLKTSATNPGAASSSSLDDIVNQQKKRLDATTRDFVTNTTIPPRSDDANVISAAAPSGVGHTNGSSSSAIHVNPQGAANGTTGGVGASVSSHSPVKMDVVGGEGSLGLGAGTSVASGVVGGGEGTSGPAGMDNAEDDDDDDDVL
jgi:hypothetical protein